MSNREKILWAVYAGVLVLLFLLSSTDVLIKEEKKTVYSISVIVSDTNDEYFTNFRKGMEKAAEKLQADVNFITLYFGHNVYEQMEMVKREAKDGADAIILDPVREAEVLTQLDELSLDCPVILLGDNSWSASVWGALNTDQYAEGSMLAEKALEHAPGSDMVWMFAEGLEFSGNERVYNGVCDTLKESGTKYRLIEKKDDFSFQKELERAVLEEVSITAVALDPVSLSAVAELAEENPDFRSRIRGMYGVGSTGSILRQMERGTIDGIVVKNQYDEGYRSVCSAVETIREKQRFEDVELESFYIEGKDLRNPEYEKLLYPID